jgi:hypothetical protein
MENEYIKNVNRILKYHSALYDVGINTNIDVNKNANNKIPNKHKYEKLMVTKHNIKHENK